MYRILSSLVFLFLFGFKGSVHNDLLVPTTLEDVKVGNQYITIVMFDEEVKEVLISSKEYVANVNKNVILLRSTKVNTAPTSLVVTFKSGQKIFNGLLTTTNKPQETYDFRTQKKEEKAEEEAPNQDIDVLKKIEHLKTLPQECCTVGSYSRYHDIILTNIFNDEKYTYLKIYLENKTSLSFDLFEANFRHCNSKKSRAIVHPIYGLEDRSIPAYGYKELIYVLPRYTTKKSGKLLVSFTEESGARVINLSIPASTLLEAKYYGESH
jgi:hypothetical protein